MRDKNCELCAGSGWYGDNGPGIKGNREYVPCERCNPSGSTFDIIMKEPNRKESFHKKYKEFLHEEKLIEERDKYLALLEEAVLELEGLRDHINQDIMHYVWNEEDKKRIDDFLARAKERLG